MPDQAKSFSLWKFEPDEGKSHHLRIDKNLALAKYFNKSMPQNTCL